MLLTPLVSTANILLFCDSAKLARAIEMLLPTAGNFQTYVLGQVTLGPVDMKAWDLAVIAYSTPSIEPLDVLRQAGLTEWLGHRPVLITAPPPCAGSPGELVWCLEFPFEAQTLSNWVAEILLVCEDRVPPACQTATVDGRRAGDRA